MPLSESQLLALATQIQDEVQDAANTAERVGGFLVELIRAATKPYDPTAAYSIGQYVFFADGVYRSEDAVTIGESPSLVPTKWRLLTGRDTFDIVAKRGNADQVGKTDQLMKLLGGLILGNIDLTSDSLPSLLIDADGKVWKGNAGSVITPPTAPPDTWGEPVHYEAMDSGSVDPIYAVVETSGFLPDDTPIPVVANPQADVTITAAGDQTITLAENEFTVTGGTKTLQLKAYNSTTNTVYNLPEGITFDPATRVITALGAFTNQVITLRVICQDILGQANWDDFVLTVNRTVAANTVAYVQARFVPNYFGSNSDLLEVQMMDGYADAPMYCEVKLASASPPTTHGLNFERAVSGAGNIRSFQLASGQNLKSKSYKIYISKLDSGAGDIGIYNFTTGTTAIGFTTL